MRLALTLLLSLALTACGTSLKPSVPLTVPQVADACQPDVAAPSRPEPAMPEGLDAEAFYEALIGLAGEEKASAWWQWFTDTWPEWARTGWRRLDAARKTPPCP